MALATLMKDTIFNFNFLGLRYSVAKSALYGSALVWLVATILAYFLAHLTILDSIIAGVLATILHWLGEIVHQYGHYLASKAVEHPMIGVRLWAIIGSSLYPKEEGELPAGIHIRRALGGPAISFVVLIISAAVWYFVGSYSPMTNFLLLWIVWEQILIYALAALLPIKIGDFAVDGGTILYWLRKR
jgi:hypothetical protein